MKILGKNLQELIMEIIIVVISILIAFFLDNWWSGVQDGRERALIVEDLTAEFIENHQLLVLEKRWVNVGKNQLQTFLQNGASSVDQMDSVIYYAIGSPSYQPKVTVSKELVHAGKMDYLKSRELRYGLSAWQQLLVRKDHIEQNESRRVDDYVNQYLYDKVNFLRMLPFKKESPVVNGNKRWTEHEKGLADELHFTNYVADQWYHFHQYEKVLDSLATNITLILNKLENE